MLCFTTNKGLYIACCRSPLLDEGHLQLVSKELGIEFSELKRFWKKLRPFGVDFVDEVLRSLPEGVTVSADVEEPMKLLGRFYKAYAFDVIMFNILRRMTPSGKGGTTDLKIELLIESGPLVIGRTIVGRLGSRELPAVPVVGFLVERDVLDIKGMLDSSTVRVYWKAAEEVLLDLEGNGKGRGAKLPEQAEFADHEWCGRVFCSSSLKKEYVHQLRAGFRTGTGTAPVDLVRQLGDDVKEWENFKDMLQELSDANGHNVEDAQMWTLWCRVFSDLLEVANRLPGRPPSRIESTRKSLVKFLLDLHREYLPLDPAPATDGFPEVLRDELFRDLVGGERSYLSRLEEEFIPSSLRMEKYDPDVVVLCLQRDWHRTMKTMLGATEQQEISVREDPGWVAWQTVINWHKGLPSGKRQLDWIYERLYELDAPGLKRGLLDFYSNALGVLASAATVGYAPAVPMIQWFQQRAHRKFVDNRLQLTREGENADV
jgi:hypothetical protein